MEAQNGGEAGNLGDEDLAGEEDSGEVQGARKIVQPRQPTEAERREHEKVHCPYRSWCEHCVRGQGAEYHHSSVAGANAAEGVPRVILDYCFFTEDASRVANDHGESIDADTSLTALVMKETLCGSVWAYALKSKSVSEDPWIADQLVDDMRTVGLANERVLVKSDQEASIVDLQLGIAKRREYADYGVGTGIENSKVGDSNSNGKIERAIRDVGNLVRTLRSALETKIGAKLNLSMAVIPWLIRHAAYIITRCRVRSHGKTSLQLMKGRVSLTELLPFAEVVLFKIPKTGDAVGSFEDRWDSGVWLGSTIRDGMHLIGTAAGVFKVGTLKRKPDGEQWSADLVRNIVGSPQRPEPGSETRRVTTFAKKKLSGKPAQEDIRFQPPTDVIPEPRNAKLLKTDVEKYGASPGCPACRAIVAGKPWRSAHTALCRQRLETMMKDNEEDRSRVQRANDRLSHAIVDKEELAEEEENKKRKLEPQQSQGELPEEPAAASSTQEAPSAARRSSGLRREGGVSEERGQESASSGSKRRAEEEADDSARAEREEEEILDDALPSVRTAILGKGSKRRAEVEADDQGRGDIQEQDHQEEEDVGMSSLDCNHCGAKFRSRNLLFAHLYQQHDADGEGARMREAASAFDPSLAGCASVRPIMAVEDFRGHPSPILKTEEISTDELKWCDIGSGIFAKTFRNVDALPLTSKGGPVASDVYRRVVRSLTSGKVIDDCILDDVADDQLKRGIGAPDNLRVELIMREALAMYRREGADVVELYSQPRIAQESALRRYGGTTLRAGWSLDLTMRNPSTGKPWDLSDKDTQKEVMKLVVESKPFVLIGSPPCTAFSQLQGLNNFKRDPDVVRKELAEACAHIAFCFELYEVQRRAGRYFMHERPSSASSWNRPEVLRMLLQEGVELVEVDMCDFGMVASDEFGEALVRKRTKILTNSPEIARKVARRCSGDHRHVHLIGGKAKRAQLYPRAFSRAVCEGVAAQKRLHGLGLQHNELMSVEAMRAAVVTLTGKSGPADGLHEDEVAFDDQSGAVLLPSLVREARKSEISYFRDMRVYDKVPIQECWDVTGADPITTRWVDINKGDILCPNYRSRLVAREFNTHTTDRPEWYAATPPGETLRLMLSLLASSRGAKLMYADVSRAYFYAPAVRAVYVKLPAEDIEKGDEGMVGRLKMSMYGTRDAAANWSAEYGSTLLAAGYRQGKASPCIFHNESSNTTIMVHGDDFVGVGQPEELARLRRALEEKYKLKVEMLSGEKGDVQEVKILNKIVRWTNAGVELEADPRHAEIVIRELGLENATASKVPGVKPLKSNVESDEPEELAREDARRYRAIAARLNYLAPDRFDVGYSTKEAARNMARPLNGDFEKLKRIGRYLVGRPRLISKYAWQKLNGTVTTFADSDWAGCEKTRRSTSGGIVTIGTHVLKTWSKQQKTVALSSAEAELHAMVAASAETLGIIALMADMGMRVEGEVYSDSTAALGIAQRSGIGKLRHVRTQALWVQEVRAEGRLSYKKVLGSRNPADALTKYMAGTLMDQHVATVGMEFRGGRADSAPELNLVEAYTERWCEKVVRFNPVVEMKGVASEGKGLKVSRAKQTRRWSEEERRRRRIHVGDAAKGEVASDLDGCQ